MDNSGFTGEHSQTVDDKGRVAVPAKFRLTLDDLVPGGEPKDNPVVHLVYGVPQTPYVECFSQTSMNAILARIQTLDVADRRRGFLSWLYNARKQIASVDDAGRLQLGPTVRNKLGVKSRGKAMFVGTGDRFQIWNPVDYRSAENEFENLMDSLQATYGRHFHPLELLEKDFPSSVLGRNGGSEPQDDPESGTPDG
ncbi:MAG: hypothetical protein OXI81_00535 [Paracoccaceae bacterium]|nr:hypothetical protein [Paracoccaceae bacterium]MDE2915301.1 hypothetical protein [Paracoccaceae bacterium]